MVGSLNGCKETFLAIKVCKYHCLTLNYKQTMKITVKIKVGFNSVFNFFTNELIEDHFSFINPLVSGGSCDANTSLMQLDSRMPFMQR